MTDDLQPILQTVPALRDEAPVMCQECGHWWQVDPDDADPWRCRSCGRKAVYAVQPSLCPRCGNSCLVVRHGHDMRRGLCTCHWTAEQRRVANRDRERSRMEAERERAQQEVATARLTVAREAEQASRDCYERRSRTCVEPKGALPYAFCGACPRFR